MYYLPLRDSNFHSFHFPLCFLEIAFMILYVLVIVFDLDEDMDFPCTLVTRSECHKVEVPRVLEQSKSS